MAAYRQAIALDSNMILRSVTPPTPTAELARELGCRRRPLPDLRHRQRITAALVRALCGLRPGTGLGP
jgi:hypothetical protein